MRGKWLARVGVPALAALLASCTGGDPGESVLPGVDAIVFQQNAFIGADGNHNVTGGAMQVIDYERYVPGGGVMVLSPPTPNGELRNLTESFEGVDIKGIDLSFDATQVVFSMRHGGDSHFHIYVANVTGDPDIRQLTFGDYNDIRPIFLPGDRIGFSTNQPFTEMGTRRDEYERAAVPQIATISSLTGDADRRLCPQNLSHSTELFLLSDGRMAFAQWSHVGENNDVNLRVMNTDCTQIVGLAGSDTTPSNSIIQFQEIAPGEFVGIATSRRGTIQAGSLVYMDARSEDGVGEFLLDEQHARYEVLTPQVPTGEASPPSGVGRYRRPFPLDDSGDTLIVGWADGDINDRNELAQTAPNFGIYLFDVESRRRTLVFDDPNMWDGYAIPVRPRETPPVHPGVLAPAPDPNEPSVFGSIDVTISSLPENVSGAQFDGTPLQEALGDAVKVRIIEGFSSEIGPVRDFGLTMDEGAAIVGEPTVYEDGSWLAAVPANLPYRLQPIDRYGMAIRNQRTWIQAAPAEQRQCGGCHESRVGQVLPRMGPTTLAQQAGPEDFNIAIPDRHEIPWDGAPSGANLQDVFDNACVQCHDGGAMDPFAGRSYQVEVTTMEGEMLMYDIPYLLLTDEPIEVYYDNELVAFPASYVTLLYPGAMMGDSLATGDVPPMWVEVGFARQSRLIEKVNMNSELDASDWAWLTESHPEDVGVTLSREERLELIRMADLGGQYFTRRNVDGAPAY